MYKVELPHERLQTGVSGAARKMLFLIMVSTGIHRNLLVLLDQVEFLTEFPMYGNVKCIPVSHSLLIVGMEWLKYLTNASDSQNTNYFFFFVLLKNEGNPVIVS